ncbi:CoA transferase [Microbacterium sp. EF45047]|nr:CoA transferase [Microbacterium neungamense]WCM56871.1 CoA transferase [Microbacterium sp. EF45047]
MAAAYRSDRLLTIDGIAPDVWSALSGFWRARDGWIRTHGNYPHHARALRRGLALPADAAAGRTAETIAGLDAEDAVTRITDAGGLAVRVLPEDPARDRELRRRALIPVTRLSTEGPTRQVRTDPALPLAGIRILDLTRVIAGPVCTRTLALLGAEVLRIDPPGLAEPEWQHLDTGHGKRSAIADARAATVDALIDGADVVVLGYRPSGLAAIGLSPDTLAARRPGLVIAQLSAWGEGVPDRRGFDSLVQAESGIAVIESPDGERPGALPAQALDHSAGYLLAAGVCTALRRRRDEGGTWLVRTSLRRVAAELLGMPRRSEPEPERPFDPAAHSQAFEVAGRAVVTAASAIPGFAYAAPRPWGADVPSW